MKKLFALLAFAGLFLTACDDGNGGEKNGAVTIDASDKNKTMAADDIEVTVSFEASGAWTASLQQITPATDAGKAPDWAEIQGSSSGEAGNHTLTIKVDANTAKTTRSFGVSIKCGKSTAGAVITQNGTSGGNTGSDAKQVKSVKATDLKDDTQWVSDITYDDKGRVASIRNHDPAFENGGEYADTLNFSYGTGTVTIKNGDYEYVAELNGDGYAETVSCKGNEDKVTLTYTNGYLTKTDVPSQSYSDYHFKWIDGNMVKCWLGEREPADHETAGFDRYAYSDHANDKTTIDLNRLFSSIPTYATWDEDGILGLLGYSGYIGKRSAKLTTTYFIGMKSVSTDPSGLYYYTGEADQKPLVYTLDSEGYVTKITLAYTISKYKVEKSSGNKTLESKSDHSSVYEITYND